MCSTVCLTAEEKQTAPDTNSTTGGCLANLRMPHGLKMKEYSTSEEGQLCVVYSRLFTEFFLPNHGDTILSN